MRAQTNVMVTDRTNGLSLLSLPTILYCMDFVLVRGMHQTKPQVNTPLALSGLRYLPDRRTRKVCGVQLPSLWDWAGTRHLWLGTYTTMYKACLVDGHNNTTVQRKVPLTGEKTPIQQMIT
jgi:hypothetical protein